MRRKMMVMESKMKRGFFCWERDGGFTMIEMLVAFIIIGVLVAVGIPAFSGWLPDYRLKSATTDLFSNLQLAKMEAIRANGDCEVSFDTSGGGSYQLTGPSGTIKTVALSEYGSGIGYGRPGGGDSVTYSGDVTFKASGMTTNIGGWVYIKNDKDRYYRVGTLLTGVVRLRKWNGSDWE